MAIALGLLPIVIPMIPELIKDIQLLIATMETGAMTPEQKANAIADLKGRLAAKQKLVEEYRFKDV